MGTDETETSCSTHERGGAMSGLNLPDPWSESIRDYPCNPWWYS